MSQCVGCRQTGGPSGLRWKRPRLFIGAAYHFEVGLLQLASPLLQPLGENSQLCVLPPQPPDLLLGFWGAALPLEQPGNKHRHQTPPGAQTHTDAAVPSSKVTKAVIQRGLLLGWRGLGPWFYIAWLYLYH